MKDDLQYYERIVSAGFNNLCDSSTKKINFRPSELRAQLNNQNSNDVILQYPDSVQVIDIVQ